MREQAIKWARAAKLGPTAQALARDAPLEQIYQAWSTFRQGYLPEGVSMGRLPDRTHGAIQIGPSGQHIVISQDSDAGRQDIALVHELLHPHVPGYEVTEAEHKDLHLLATGLATHVFPQRTGEMVLLDAEHTGAEQNMRELILTDQEEQIFKTLFRKPGIMPVPDRRGGLLPRPNLIPGPDGTVVPIVRTAPVEVGPGRNGWIIPYLKKMWQANSFVWPIRGVTRLTPAHSIDGWRVDSFEAFLQAIYTTLDSAGTTPTTKAQARATMAAGATTCSPAAATRIGLIVTLSDTITAAENAPIFVEHFVAGGTQMDYLVNVEMDKGIAQYLILHAINDRGGGVPRARDDLNFRIPAAGARVGLVLHGESVNYRELQA